MYCICLIGSRNINDVIWIWFFWNVFFLVCCYVNWLVNGLFFRWYVWNVLFLIIFLVDYGVVSDWNILINIK